MKHLLGGSVRGRQPSLWLLMGMATIVAVLMLASLGPAGASRLFQSEEETSVIGEIPTDTPEAVQASETPGAGQPTPAGTTAGQPTTAPTSGQPGAPTTPKPSPAVATAQPSPVQSTPVKVTAQPTTSGAVATYTPIATPSGGTSGGPAPVVWIIVGLVLVGLVVVIIISPGRKPKSSA